MRRRVALWVALGTVIGAAAGAGGAWYGMRAERDEAARDAIAERELSARALAEAARIKSECRRTFRACREWARREAPGSQEDCDYPAEAR